MSQLSRAAARPGNEGDKLTTLTTDRLILREFVEDDWRAVLAYQSDARYLKYYPRTRRTAEEVRDFVRGFIECQGERPRTKHQLAVVSRAEGRLIGTCGIRMETADFRRANIGYEIANVLGKRLRDRSRAGHSRVRLGRTAAASYLGALRGREHRFLAGAGKGRDA